MNIKKSTPMTRKRLERMLETGEVKKVALRQEAQIEAYGIGAADRKKSSLTAPPSMHQRASFSTEKKEI